MGKLSSYSIDTAPTILDTVGGIDAETGDNKRYQIGDIAQLNPYCFRAYGSITTSLTDNSYVTIDLATEVYDYNSNFASDTYTAPYTGVYHFDGLVTHQTASAATIVIANTAIYVDGTIHTAGPSFPGQTGGVNGWGVSGDILLTAGQAVTLRHLQDSGGAETSATGAYQTWFAGHLVHRVF